MAQSDTVFAGSIPALYNRYLGPLIFEPYAADLATRVASGPAGRVLETAAGTGVLTRALAASLPGAAEIVATDLNQPMLDFAAAQPGVERVQWQRADALSLPFPDRSFDAVACQFGAMFFPDKIAGYREALRVLRPGGRFVFSVWDRIEENEFADVVTEAVAALFPGDPPNFLARTPHGYHDGERIGAELAAAGFAPHRHRDRRAPQPRRIAARSGDRLLPGHAAAQRDRGPRSVPSGRGDRCRCRRARSALRSPARSTGRYRRS